MGPRKYSAAAERLPAYAADFEPLASFDEAPIWARSSTVWGSRLAPRDHEGVGVQPDVYLWWAAKGCLELETALKSTG